MNYKDLINESGFLTPRGKELIEQEVLPNAEKFLDMMETEVELRIMSGILAKHIGDMVATKVVELANKQKPFFNMSDEDFETYLKSKYGEEYILVSLTKEELERCPQLDEEKLRKAWAEGLKAFQEAVKNPSSVSLHPGLHFIGK